MAFQFSILLGTPFLDGPVSVGQHLRAHLDDASQGAAGGAGETEQKGIGSEVSRELRTTIPLPPPLGTGWGGTRQEG